MSHRAHDRHSRRKPPPRHSDHHSLARSLAGAVVFALLFRTFVAEANVIPSGSMMPTLLIGDRIVVSKFTYGLKLPLVPIKLTDGRPARPGEVVVFTHPDTGETLVKRVVAVGGDTVAMVRNTLWVNGKAVPRTPLPGPCSYLDVVEVGSDKTVVRPCQAYTETLGGQRYTVFQQPDSTGFSMAPRRVPEGHVFMLGDNRDNSNDSR